MGSKLYLKFFAPTKQNAGRAAGSNRKEAPFYGLF